MAPTLGPFPWAAPRLRQALLGHRLRSQCHTGLACSRCWQTRGEISPLTGDFLRMILILRFKLILIFAALTDGPVVCQAREQ